MSEVQGTRSDRIYRAILRVLPFDFRSEFGDEMEEVFRQQRADTRPESGIAALARMWFAGIADVFRMAPREHLSVLATDIRFAARMMRRNLAYTVGAILILGLGIGVNTSIFSVVNSVLLKPLPFVQGDRLVVLRQSAPKAAVGDLAFSVVDVYFLHQRNHSLSQLAEYHSMVFTLFGGSEARRVRAGVVSADFFSLFGVHPLMGRTFRSDDDRPGAPAVLVLSYEFWKQHTAGDPNIIGRVWRMNDRPHTVVGVLPPFPQYPNENDVYMPTSACPYRSSPAMIDNRDARMMSVFARLKDGATLTRCHTDVAGIANQLGREYPKSYPAGVGYRADAFSLRDQLTTRARPLLLLLLGAAAFVLLIACANVANLILARMARREQELLVRTAIGAGAGRVLRQLLTESLMMALAAAALGVLMAAGSLRLLTQFATPLTPRAREIGIDGWVLGFAILCATATTVIFGSAAALWSRHEVASGLKRNGNRETGRSFARNALIAAQVAFSTVLLIGAGLMVHSFIRLQSVDSGYVAQRVIVADFDLNWSRYGGHPREGLSFADRLLARLRAEPGVLSAAVSSSFPLDPDSSLGGGWTSRFEIEGESRSAAESAPINDMRAATPDYFRSLGIPLLEGRPFTDSDKADSLPVAIVSHSLARRRWGAADPIGRRVSFDNGKTWITVVGVVGDVKERGPAQNPSDQFYRPLTQATALGAVVVRTAADPQTTASQIRRAIVDLDPETAIPYMQTLEQARQESVSEPRNTVRLVGGFAVLAFIIAIAGVAYMLALWVRQRTREIGIRIAVGAKPRDIVGIVMREGMTLVLIGLLAGAAGSLALTRFLKALLFEVTPTDAPTYLAAAAMLLCAGIAACWIPGRRAALIDPQVALRSE